MIKPRLLYFFDTMCSWCYGFAPEMEKILSAQGERVEFVFFSGGLRPFTREPMDDKMRDFLANVHQRIHDVTGQPFSDPAKRYPPGFVYDTEPAARAVALVREMKPEDAYRYMIAIQQGYYAGGDDITKAETLAKHAEAFGVARADFLAAFDSQDMREATLADFQVSQQLGVKGFPMLVVHRKNAKGEDELLAVSNGYAKAEEILPRVEMVLKDHVAS